MQSAGDIRREVERAMRDDRSMERELRAQLEQTLRFLLARRPALQ
jgi:hypothetical protein